MNSSISPRQTVELLREMERIVRACAEALFDSGIALVCGMLRSAGGADAT